jgi:hypothetical protein
MAVTLVCDENRRLGEAENFSDGAFPVAFIKERPVAGLVMYL